MQHEQMMMSASTLSCDKVCGMQGENLGRIEQIMVDMEQGRVGYAVLTFNNFSEAGNKLFAVPWKALKVDKSNKHFVLNFDKEKIRNAPCFDQNNWPNMADQSWGRDIHSYYGSQPYWN